MIDPKYFYFRDFNNSKIRFKAQKTVGSTFKVKTTSNIKESPKKATENDPYCINSIEK